MSNFRFTPLFVSFLLCLSGVLSAADGDLRVAGKLVSDVATGQPPLVVNSTTVIPNFNADMLDGMHASDFALQSDGYISFPLWALELHDNATTISPHAGVWLTSGGNSSFGSNVVIPSDYAPGTDVLFDILVHNPAPNGACQAVLNKNYVYGYRPGGGAFFPLFGFSGAFPVFPSGNSTISHRYILRNVQAGDAVLFGWFRRGDDADDNCGIVFLAGVSMRYQKL
ncbi:hypothetical protein [Thiolapillus sp.]